MEANINPNPIVPAPVFKPLEAMWGSLIAVTAIVGIWGAATFLLFMFGH